MKDIDTAAVRDNYRAATPKLACLIADMCDAIDDARTTRARLRRELQARKGEIRTLQARVAALEAYAESLRGGALNLEALRRLVRTRGGGDVQKALGR